MYSHCDVNGNNTSKYLVLTAMATGLVALSFVASHRASTALFQSPVVSSVGTVRPMPVASRISHPSSSARIPRGASVARYASGTEDAFAAESAAPAAGVAPQQAASSIMNMFLIGIPAACVAAFAYLQRRPQAPAAAAAGYGTLPLPTNAFGAGYTVSAHRGAAATRLYSSASANVETSKRSAMITEEEKRALLDKTDVFVFDCDGVIWKGDSLIEGVPETLEMLKAMGKKMFFVTNNSTKSRAGYLKKFLSLGLKVEADEIYSSSYAAAAYLESIDFPKDKKVYVIGEVGIQEELDLVGIQHIGGPADAGKVVELTPGLALDHDKDVAAVVVGFDRYFNYHKIQTAQLCINENPGCMFIATNTDAVTHLTDAQEWAGNGSMVGCIKGCTNREPTVVGKPSGFMLDNIANKFGIDKSKICMVGDRLDTDILFGQNNGTNTMLVFTGVTTPETLEKSPVNPDNLIPGIADLMTVKQ
eukprot:CAMPEP_0174285700 /NCGR_PEP_ID=MMETSP0809-20121228/9436_1 /TAXON_ID=73025 ORGANISM="Eutreptiella gymnastica-like, Strain CCMP1594" /NCGR_SAMPLE_ID=MMETSP0809 /ASSEMBLY_ACC=CAM_ASM_000658 /LENGTH=474 /DNA_ID=CAMNT_0015381539 /DNA_START=28 /DNA_END=1452 /DNA_ORIENTATION=+